VTRKGQQIECSDIAGCVAQVGQAIKMLYSIRICLPHIALRLPVAARIVTQMASQRQRTEA
jgi:hypothetical protein